MLTKKKVLLLDDNMSVTEESIAALAREYDVERCKEIGIAAHRMKVYHIDLFVIDLMMPPKGLNVKDEFNAGFLFYEQYVKDKYPHTPVLFWTNLNESSYDRFMSKNKEKTWLFYLQKSEDNQALLNEVKRIFGGGV